MADTTQIVVLLSLLQEALKRAFETLENARKFKRNRRVLRSTFKDLTPLFLEIKQYNEGLDHPREEIITLVKQKDAQDQPACKFSSMALLWNRIWHGNDDGSNVVDEKQAAMVEDVKRTLYKVREILVLLNQEKLDQKVFANSCGVPENPQFTVGLDEPLGKLKMEVLSDGASIIGITGLGGSGKTTLATKLCCDQQVKGKFKENILFVTFSKTPKLDNIVERLFQHCGYQVPEFQSDEDAVNWLGLLLRKIGRSPILLVLDDVWPGSEALVEKFKLQIPDYKILVTSRVAFTTFDTVCVLKPLGHQDALILFRHIARIEQKSDEDVVQKVVRLCKGSPLAIKVISRSLSHQPYELWEKMVENLSQGHSFLDSNTELITSLKKVLDVLEEKPVIKECFKDLGLFLEDQRIPVTALIDMWAELYELDDDGTEAMSIINKLDSMNLANVLVARKNTSDTDSYYYNNHFIILHDLLRELAIHESNQEPIEQRKRLIIDANENNREQHQGKIARIYSKFIGWCVKQKPLQVPAHTLSISNDETSTSYWSNFQPAEAEVLILNLRTKKFPFPEIMEKMSKLKALIVTNHGFHPSEFDNTKVFDSLYNLKRIRLERISVPSFGTLKNLKKLSLYMCNVSQAFERGTILFSDEFPNLVDLNIDYCKDMVGLPNEVCDITPLKKLSVTNCHKLLALPQGIGKLENLELLRLSSCTDLEGLPDSIGRLSNLRLLDISNCISLPSLPEDIGDLPNLRNIYMTNCARCELPYSVINFEDLKVTCDEETAASWEVFNPNLKIEVPRVDVNLHWLH